MQWVVDHVLVSADRDLLAVLGLGFGLALLVQLGMAFCGGGRWFTFRPAWGCNGRGGCSPIGCGCRWRFLKSAMWAM